MFPRKAGSVWGINSPAKLNLYLEILDRQESGYHELETLMVTIRLADSLHWTPEVPHPGHLDSTQGAPSTQGSGVSPRQQAPPDSLCLRVIQRMDRVQLPNSPSHQTDLVFRKVPENENNIVLQAAHLIAQRAGILPYGTFTLTKRIPTCAGMGGGSSNAAATLVLANTAWKLGFSQAQLLNMAAELGSDVPYFIATHPTRSAAICRGRGECVETIESLGQLHFVLIIPPQGISTKELFRHTDLETIQKERCRPSPLPQLTNALRRSELVAACQSIFNRLEPIALQRHDWLRRLREELIQIPSCGFWMTGSGSTYVGLVRTAREAQHLTGILKARCLGEIITTTSC